MSGRTIHSTTTNPKGRRDTMTTRRGTFLLTAALLGAGCSNGEAPTQETLPQEVALAPEDVATARIETMSAGTVVTGTLRPYLEVEIRAQVPGVVSDLRVDRGDPVSEGQVMARVEAEGIRGQAASARAAVASAEANLALALRQLESSRRLHGAGAMSDIELQQAEAAYEAAEAQLASARAQSAGATESARRSVVVAPIAGEVSARAVSQGEAVQPGQALLTVVNSSILELAGQVPVAEATRLRPGMPVEFTVEAYPGRTFAGSVARVEPTADPGTRQVGVYVRLPNEERSLVGGLFARGVILSGDPREVVVVPTGAVREEGGAAHVLVVAEGRAVTTPVTLGERDAARGVVAILSGLDGGETVVVAPGEVEEGAEVRIEAEAGARGADR